MRPFLSVLGRDLAIAALTGLLVGWDGRLRAEEEPGALGLVVGVTAGVAVPLTAFLAHEWGHLMGAVLSGGRVSRPPRVSPYLFFYDTARSTRAQFLWMSAGGYAATAVAVLPLLAWAEPGAASGLVALALTVLGVGVTLALEVPTTVRVWRGAPLPTGGVYTS